MPYRSVKPLTVACLIVGGADVVVRLVAPGMFGEPLWPLALAGLVLLTPQLQFLGLRVVIFVSGIAIVWSVILITVRIAEPTAAIPIIPTIGYLILATAFAAWAWIVLRSRREPETSGGGEAATRIGYALGKAVQRWRRQ